MKNKQKRVASCQQTVEKEKKFAVSPLYWEEDDMHSTKYGGEMVMCMIPYRFKRRVGE